MIRPTRGRSCAAEIWAAIHDWPLSIADAVDPDELQSLVDFGLRVWRELRDTQYLGELVAAGVRSSYYERYGERPIVELLAHVGVGRAVLRAEAEQLAPEIIEGLAETGLLETLIRSRLAPFYASDEFARALAEGR